MDIFFLLHYQILIIRTPSLNNEKTCIFQIYLLEARSYDTQHLTNIPPCNLLSISSFDYIIILRWLEPALLPT